MLMEDKIQKLIKDFPLKDKRLWRFFGLFFVLNLVAINWNSIYWMFNQKAVYGELKTLVKEKPKNEEIASVTGPGQLEEYFNFNDSIIIPAININAPIIFPEGNTQKDFQVALKNGTILYPDSVFPGEKGVTTLLGHSAPANWPRIDYDWVFNDISKLQPGDEITIYFNHRQYTYKVTSGQVLDRGGSIPSAWFSGDKPTLVLLSCWPPGKDYKRFGVVAEFSGVSN